MLQDALDARLARLRAKYGLPGVSAAIIFADGSMWRGTGGDADVAAGVPVTPDTSFSVASVSKTFTAALILALIEDGRLSLDGSAKGYLPSLPIDPAITVRELLDHTSGLRDFFFGRQEVRTKVYTVVDDLARGPVDVMSGHVASWLDDPFALESGGT
jgi:CubicO group peptidase (beta-lactamase class C family)